jgi:hypothetical protein
MNELLQKLPNWAIIVFVAYTLLTSADSLDIINVLGERDETWHQRYQQEMREHAQTRKDYNRLKADVSVLNGELIKLPWAFWIKDRESYIIYANQTYEDEILIPLGLTTEDIIGTRGEPMGIELADILSNDQRVLKLGYKIEVRESVGDRLGTSYKFPIYEAGVIVAMGGFWIEDQ